MKKLMTQLIIGLLVTISCYSIDLNAQNIPDTDQQLSERLQGIIPIAALTARGDLDQLRYALSDGLDAGLTINEIKEVLVHLNAYAGFPRSIRGLQTFMEVLDEREARGVSDEWGSGASPIDDDLEPMLRGHFNICLNVGLKPGQLQHFVSVIESTLGDQKANTAQSVLDEVLENRSEQD